MPTRTAPFAVALLGLILAGSAGAAPAAKPVLAGDIPVAHTPPGGTQRPHGGLGTVLEQQRCHAMAGRGMAHVAGLAGGHVEAAGLQETGLDVGLQIGAHVAGGCLGFALMPHSCRAHAAPWPRPWA